MLKLQYQTQCSFHLSNLNKLKSLVTWQVFPVYQINSFITEVAILQLGCPWGCHASPGRAVCAAAMPHTACSSRLVRCMETRGRPAVRNAQCISWPKCLVRAVSSVDIYLYKSDSSMYKYGSMSCVSININILKRFSKTDVNFSLKGKKNWIRSLCL